MTQPTALDQTFDTSLIDTHQQLPNRSFSSTETNTSRNSIANNNNNNNNNHRPGPSKTHGHTATMSATQPGEPFTAVTNAQLYDNWAETYDTDGNVLQSVDDLELETMLPKLLGMVCQACAKAPSGGGGERLRVLDFGCGTGRNTVKLLQLPWVDDVSGASDKGLDVDVHGWDASEAMLALAHQKCSAATSTTSQNVKLAALKQVDFSSASAIPQELHGAFDAIISTLVLEHLPVDTFFIHLGTLLKPGGYALVTNMHPDMGRSTRAGYKNESGERVKGESWVHGVEESVGAAREEGLEVFGMEGVRSVRETEVDEGMIEKGVVGSRGKKWTGVRVWYGFMVRKMEG